MDLYLLNALRYTIPYDHLNSERNTLMAADGDVTKDEHLLSQGLCICEQPRHPWSGLMQTDCLNLVVMSAGVKSNGMDDK